MARRIAAAALLACVVVNCRRNKEPATDATALLRFDTARVRLVTPTDTLTLILELAGTREQQTMGLMERRHLADTAGMLFVYGSEQPETAAFWMFRTRIPLEIAFIDSTGIIRAVHHMVPCEAATVQQCPTYPPGVAYRAALEVNAGYFDRNKVRVGDRVILADTGKP